MNKINKLGQRLIEFKDEYNKDYPPIVLDSMNVALNQMLLENRIDMSTFDYIINKNITKKMFLDFIDGKKEYTKSIDELKKEYEDIRLTLVDALTNHEIESIETDYDIEKEALIASKPYHITEQFIMEYFGVTEKEMPKMMKKGGFVEIFVSLRLGKVFADIVEHCNTGISHLKLEHSLPYVNKEGGYNIDVAMEINIDDFCKQEWREKIVEEIKKISISSEILYKKKMIA